MCRHVLGGRNVRQTKTRGRIKKTASTKTKLQNPHPLSTVPIFKKIIGTIKISKRRALQSEPKRMGVSRNKKLRLKKCQLGERKKTSGKRRPGDQRQGIRLLGVF